MVNNLTDFMVDVEVSLQKKHDVLAAYLDVSGAFNDVIIDILLQKLANIGCPLNLLKFIKFQMYERKIMTEITENDVRYISRGVPQGGVLSPLLYCIYVSNIIDNVPKSVKVSQFADDIGIWCNRGSVKKLKN